jgi:hypothetical protein
MVAVGERNLKRDEDLVCTLTSVRQSRYSASSVSRAWTVCWCDTFFFRVFLCGLLVLVLPSESLFFVAANAAAGAGFLVLGRFFVEVLPIGGVRIDFRSGWLCAGLSGIEIN